MSATAPLFQADATGEFVVIVKYGELSLKGQNRGRFEQRLSRNIRNELGRIPHRIRTAWKRMYIHAERRHFSTVAGVLGRAFGLVGYAEGLQVAKGEPELVAAGLEIARWWLGDRLGGTFKVEARREDKSFPLRGYDIACRLGDEVRARYPGMVVDVRNPELTIHVEVRDCCYVYGPVYSGSRGLPLGSSGKGLLLLSGGIDSPVAGYLMARRGLMLDALHFHTYPFTSAEAEAKVGRLAQQLRDFIPDLTVWSVPFTEVQLRIRERAEAEKTTLLMRACMMLAAQDFAASRGCHCLVTGESLGQVASQTVQNLAFTNAQVELPVFRPLIGFDKDQIIAISQEIGTFETSILPYPDCCTLFAAKHPVLWPSLDEMQQSLVALGLDELLQQALLEARRLDAPVVGASSG